MIARLFRVALMAASIALGVPSAQAQPSPFKLFASPDLAMTDFVDAVRQNNEAELRRLLGSGWRVFVPDAKDDEDRHRERFLAAWDASHKIVPVTEGKVLVEVGTTGYVMPTPLVKDTAGWRFDVMAGAREIQARHIGHNELTVAQTMLAIVDAEHEYAMLDPMKVGVPVYAARLMSTPGRKDGLYWPAKLGETPSPLGALVAKAQPGEKGAGEKGQGFFGYHFRLLEAQGAAAQGSAGRRRTHQA